MTQIGLCELQRGDLMVLFEHTVRSGAWHSGVGWNAMMQLRCCTPGAIEGMIMMGHAVVLDQNRKPLQKAAATIEARMRDVWTMGTVTCGKCEKSIPGGDARLNPLDEAGIKSGRDIFVCGECCPDGGLVVYS